MEGNGFDMDHPGGGHAYDPMHRSVRDDVLTEAWPANVKRTYDETGRPYLEYQDVALHDRKVVEARLAELRKMEDASFTAYLSQQQTLQSMGNRAMTNALTADHLGSMQGYAHRDIAVNKEWNNPFTLQAFRAADEHVSGGHGLGHNVKPDASMA